MTAGDLKRLVELSQAIVPTLGGQQRADVRSPFKVQETVVGGGMGGEPPSGTRSRPREGWE